MALARPCRACAGSISRILTGGRPTNQSQRRYASKKRPPPNQPAAPPPPTRSSKPAAPPSLAPARPAPPSPKREDEERKTVWAPYWRISFGVVFIGSLIYSMLTQPVEKLDEASLAERDQRQRDEKGVTERSPMRLRMEAFIQEQQRLIVAELARVDGSAFREDHWTRAGGGGGISCVLQDGRVFEKAGVNTSVVYGRLPPAAIAQMRVHHPTMDPDADGLDFFAAGLSMVLHPHNPHAPTVHLNYRYFETSHDDGRPAGWWFGGGTDLTPAYLEEDDVRHFHAVIKAACDRHDAGYYPRFKRWCDDYFTVRHRAESRGVGGIFFDDLDGAADDDGQSKDQDQLFRFVQDCCTAFLPSYLPILRRRIHTPFTPHEKEWQQLRRGRYVEFNLVHDRGTSFGLHTPGARVESILVSLPLTAKWMYMHEPEPGSREERLLRVLRQPVDWA